jgi:hypothetical protein
MEEQGPPSGLVSILIIPWIGLVTMMPWPGVLGMLDMWLPFL